MKEYYYKCYNETDQIDFLKHLEKLSKKYRWRSGHKPTEFVPAQKNKDNEKVAICIQNTYDLYYDSLKRLKRESHNKIPFPYYPNPYNF